MRRVLVTGGAGFIGRAVCAALLNAGYEVCITGRQRPTDIDIRIGFIRADLLAPEAASFIFANRTFDILLHLAWETRHGIFWSARENQDWIAASLRLARCFADAGGGRMVATGTCVEYDAPDDGPCIANVTPLAPIHPYAVAKNEGRRLIEACCQAYGVSFAWARLFMLIGEREHPDRLVPSVVRSLLNGVPARCSSGVQVRDFMDVRDAGLALASVAASETSGALNICSGHPVRIADLARMLGDIMQRPDLIKLGTLPDRPGEVANLWGDAQPLQLLGCYAPRYTLKDTLDNAVAYWREVIHR